MRGDLYCTINAVDYNHSAMATASLKTAHRKLISVLGSSTILYLGHGLLTTLIGVRMSAEGFSPFSIGLIASSFYVGGAVGSQLCNQVIRRVGHIRAFAIFSAVLATGSLAHALFLTPLAWVLIRALSGFSLYGLNVASESWLNATVTGNIRGRVLGTYMILTFLALSMGQLLLNTGDPATFRLFSVSSMLFALALIPMALTQIPAPTSLASEHLSIRRLYRISPLALVGSLASGMVIGTFLPLGSVYGAKIGLSTSEISLFMASGILGGLLLQWPIGALSDRHDRRVVILAVAVGTTITALLVGYLGYVSFSALLALTLLHGGLLNSIYPLSIAYGNDHIESEDQFVELSRGLLLVYFIGALVAPITGSLMMDPFGPIGLFLEIAVIAALLAAFGLTRMLRRASLPVEAQEGYQTYGPYSSTEVYELDPRYSDEPSPPPDEADK